MFDWFKKLGSRSDGTQEMRRSFEQMLEDGRHIFDAATNALLGGTDPVVIRDDLWATDKRINHNERQIRRMLMTHAVSYGMSELPFCLSLMSLVKDAERIGDYGKNIFDLAALDLKVLDDSRSDLVALKDTISKLLVRARNVYDNQRENEARSFLAESDALQSLCDKRTNALLLRTEGGGRLAATALTYRYFKRVVAHAMNIITAVVLPLDQLDYYDEDASGRGITPEED
ncbi:MAG TPA: PhoU domain-containing protein [Planctomycetota bacterium]